MSVLGNQTNLTVGDPFFVLNGNDINFISTISVYNGTINSSQINLDAIQMDCAYIGPQSTPTLLLNGAPVASVSSFTSSVVTWSSYPALSPISYAGAGGAANLATVNALTNLSSATVIGGAVNAGTVSTPSLTVSTINGLQFPSNVTTAVLTVTSSPITNGLITVVDLSALGSGFYLITVLISTGGTDPFSCSTMVRNFSSQVVGGCFHCPSIAGAAPSLANCVSIQDNGSGSNQISVIVYATSAVALGAVAQISVYRIS